MYQYTNEKRNKPIVKRKKQILKDPQQFHENIVKKWLRSYLKVSSVHGVSHLVRHGRHLAEKFLWILALLAMAFPSYLLFMFAWDHYNLNPSVVSIERDSKSWPSRIPTMTLCQAAVQMPIDINEEDDIFDDEERPEDESTMSIMNETTSVITRHIRKRDIWEFKDIDEEDNTTLNDAREKEDGPRRVYIPHKLRRHFKDILGVHFNNSEMERFLNIIILGNFTSYGELVRYKDTAYDTQFSANLYIDWAAAVAEPHNELTPNGHRSDAVLTEFGPCQMFNSDIGRFSTKAYWEQKGHLNDQDGNRTKWLPGLSTLIMHKERILPFKVFFHSPNDLIDLDSKHLSYPIDTIVLLEVHIENIWTTAEVGKLNIQQRHCRHSNESELKHSPEVYSYKLCKMECRIEMCLKYCNCTPYYYRKLDGERTCGIEGLLCLSGYASQITALEENGLSSCKCIQNCDFVNAKATPVTVEQWIMKSSIETTIYNMQRIRYKRTLIYTQIDLLVQAGGIAGLCYGMGFLSIVEFVYHITIRLCFILWRKLRDKK